MALPNMFPVPDQGNHRPLNHHQQLVEFGSYLNFQASHYLPGEIHSEKSYDCIGHPMNKLNMMQHV